MKNLLCILILFSLYIVGDSFITPPLPHISEFFYDNPSSKPIKAEYHNPHSLIAIPSRIALLYADGGSPLPWADATIRPDIASLGYFVKQDSARSSFTHLALILYKG